MVDILIKDFPTGLDGRWGSFEHVVIHGDGSVTDHLGMNIGKAKAVTVYRCRNCCHNNDCSIQFSAQSGDEFFCGYGEPRKD